MKHLKHLFLAFALLLSTAGHAIYLSATTHTLEVYMGGAVTTTNPFYVISYQDITSAGMTLPQLSGQGSFNGVTHTTALAAPAASTTRQVTHIGIYNADVVSQTIYVVKDVSATEYILIQQTLLPGQSLEWSREKGWNVPASLVAEVNVQQQLTAGAGTWTKPTSFTPKFVRVIIYGGGGGGGGGSSQTGAVVRTGGCGGGGGNRGEWTFLASDLSATENFTVGGGGTAGTAGASGADGGAGGVGTTSEFSTGTKLIQAFGGGGGAFGDNASTASAGGAGGGQSAAGGTGTTSAATGGGPGAPATPNGACGANSLATAGTPVIAEYGGGAGAGNTNVPANAVGGGSLYGGAGGGHGGGATVAPALINATAGGQRLLAGGSGGAAGTSGAAPTAGTAGATGTAATNGGNGGAGGSHGGGGGGGGVGSNTGTGGAGGVGGDGAIYIISW
jgi:hypothetical protein